MKQQLKIQIMITASAALLNGCAIFSGKDDAPPAATAGFTGVAQTTSGQLPLPVEVAHDISRIYNGEEPNQDDQPAPVDDYDRVVKAGTVKEWTGREPASTEEKSVEPPVDARKKRKKHRSTASVPPHGQVQGDQDYVVKEGDTLMKISFEKYGNLYRWREILEANKGKIGNYNKLVAGTILNIHGVEYVVVEHNGQPYLIRRNDTLGKISNNVYGTPKEWRALWENNRHLIHDPNKIYAGFTLYYMPKDSLVEPRAPASSAAKKSAAVKKSVAAKPAVVAARSAGVSARGAGGAVVAKSRKVARAEAPAPAEESPKVVEPAPGVAVSDDPGAVPLDSKNIAPSRLPKSQ